MGGLRQEHLNAAGLTAGLCSDAIKLEWTFKPRPVLYPGMPPAARTEAKRATEGASHVGACAGAWTGLRDFYDFRDLPKGEASGQVALAVKKNKDGRSTCL